MLDRAGWRSVGERVCNLLFLQPSSPIGRRRQIQDLFSIGSNPMRAKKGCKRLGTKEEYVASDASLRSVRT